MEILARNICYALPLGLEHLLTHGQKMSSRAGEVLAAPTPVMTIYTHPVERVLFTKTRDANPFFHLAEAMWMLAGRNDSEFLDRFVHDFGLRYATNGTLAAAYGHRWRHWWDYDQLEIIVNRLRADPTDRRVVLSMWDGGSDLQNIEAVSHLQRDGRKDIPCNTHVYFRIRDGLLDITVCCRSNDIIWGAYGANVVHFSFLQEYVALMVGVQVGTYYHLSNNFHAYTEAIEKIKAKSNSSGLFYSLFDDRYTKDQLSTTPLINDPETFDKEVVAVLEDHTIGVNNRFLSQTVIPALLAHQNFKAGHPAEGWLDQIKSEDWRIACTEWIERRIRSREIREEQGKSPVTIPGHI